MHMPARESGYLKKKYIENIEKRSRKIGKIRNEPWRID